MRSCLPCRLKILNIAVPRLCLTLGAWLAGRRAGNWMRLFAVTVTMSPALLRVTRPVAPVAMVLPGATLAPLDAVTLAPSGDLTCAAPSVSTMVQSLTPLARTGSAMAAIRGVASTAAMRRCDEARDGFNNSKWRMRNLPTVERWLQKIE